MLFLAALIWGFAFVAQSAGMEYVGPFTFNAVRCIIGALVLVPVALLFKPEETDKEEINNNGCPAITKQGQPIFVIIYTDSILHSPQPLRQGDVHFRKPFRQRRER